MRDSGGGTCRPRSTSSRRMARAVSASIIQTIGPLGSTSKFKSMELWEARSRFQSIGPLGRTSKLQSIGPLGSMSKFKSTDLWEAHPKFNLWTSGKHVQTSIHRTSRKHVQISNPWTSGKHVQNFKSIRPLVSMSCTHFFFLFFIPKKKGLHA